ncbi:hypothetical protein [Chitinophaga sp. S165]|uniref:hypothetical protein n=1 Tax=Chitinophaga sp. S165 TaxID=2135462 RepID=UPI000D70B3A9|nr:hypothetical protein [Chitinophaga sp. S165]PWV55959.1 hypothetical protein C7475_101470 [Chitinophaga sp. S165]
MKEINKQKIGILRQRVPIGFSHGLTVLEKTNGDIDAAEIIFKDEVLQIVFNKTGIAKDVAQKHLINSNYDIPATLKSIDEERFTLTELIYRRYKDKENALAKVVHVVEIHYNIQGPTESWLYFKTLSDLLPEIFCPLAIMRWLTYEEYESFGVALCFELDTVTDLIENVLKLAPLASSLREARDIQEIIYRENAVVGNIENYIKANNELRKNKAYQKCENNYYDQKNLLIETLYDFVKVNINKFP